MGRNGVIGLAILVGVLGLGWYGVEHREQKAREHTAEVWLPALQGKTEQVRAIEITQPGQLHVRLERREQGWLVPAKAGYPVVPGLVEHLLDVLEKARKVEARTHNPERLAQLGLAELGAVGQQGTRLSVQLADGQALMLLIGKPGQHGGQLVRMAGDTQSWLIDQHIELPQTELQWLDRRVTQIPFSEVRELVLEQPRVAPLVLYRGEGEASNAQVRDVPPGRRLTHEAAANSMVLLFADLRFADAAPLAQVGFKGEPALRFRLKTAAGQELVGALHQQGEQYWLTLKPGSGLDAQRLPGKPDWAYRLEATQYQTLAKKLTDLLVVH